MSVESSGSPVQVRAGTKHFGSKSALDGVDLDVPAGSFCVLLGPSGSGKTTLLRCIAGIERLTSGQIRIGDRLVADGPTHLPPHRRNLAMVFQDYALWPHLTAEQNVSFALRRLRLGRSEAEARTRAMMERVGLAHRSDHYPNELSGGEQQRVALARALIGGTGLVLYDEPLSNLDADLRERMRIEIATLARTSAATSVYITHDQSEAFALADTIGVLHEGRLVQFAPPEEVYHSPATAFVARFTGLAGEFPVHLVGQEGADGATLLQARPVEGGQDGCCPIVAPERPGLRPRTPATALIRPSGVQLLPAGHPERNLEAVVVDRAYRGRGYDHAVEAGEIKLVGVHDHRPWSPGERVGVRLLPAGCLLFPASGTDGAVIDSDPEAALQPTLIQL